MSLFHEAVVAAMPLVPKPLLFRFARRYVAGETLADAIRAVRELEREGAMATIDVLGEAVTTPEEARASVSEYLAVLDAIVREKLDANVSVKPTMFGLGLGRELCVGNLRGVARAASERDLFVRVDMEDSSTTDDTFWLVRELRNEWPKIGVVVQAYLRRTLGDTRRLVEERTNVRVCKGIYVEPRLLAWKDRRIIVKNFGLVVDRLLSAGNYVGIATHDEACVWEALRTIDRLGLPREAYEFQMLLGVEPSLRRILLEAGHRLRVYVPFGSRWDAYSRRRLRENPAIAGHVLRALLSRDG